MRRKRPDVLGPAFIFVLCFGNISFQIVVPTPQLDHHLAGQTMTLRVPAICVPGPKRCAWSTCFWRDDFSSPAATSAPSSVVFPFDKVKTRNWLLDAFFNYLRACAATARRINEAYGLHELTEEQVCRVFGVVLAELHSLSLTKARNGSRLVRVSSGPNAPQQYFAPFLARWRGRSIGWNLKVEFWWRCVFWRSSIPKVKTSKACLHSNTGINM